jgi:DNA-binding MarR family transcriptional regulator
METTQNPGSVNHRIREGLARIATVMRNEDWSRAKTSGLNPTQLSILELLEGRAAGLSVKEIAANLGVSQPTATDSITALERKDLVAKNSDGIDKRSVTVEITTKGRAVLDVAEPASGAARDAVDALASHEQEDLLITLVKMISHLQQNDAIPIQRMCVSCRYFAPFAHSDAARPHHCHFVDAAFGRREIRVDCREHEIADPAVQAATWTAFNKG